MKVDEESNATFGQEDHCVTQLVFGGPSTVGPMHLLPGRCIGVLGSELTHRGARTRSWFNLFCLVQPGEEPSVRSRVRGVEEAVELLGCVMQPRHHRRPGPVLELLELVADLDARSLPAWAAPPAFWRSASAAAGVGHPLRRPTHAEGRIWNARARRAG